MGKSSTNSGSYNIDNHNNIIEIEINDYNNINKEFEPKLLPQVFATLIATIGSFGLGTVVGWSSPAIPNLRDSGDLGILTEADESWIGSLSNFGAFLASFIVGGLMDKIGRKYTMFILQFPFLIGWILIVFASNLGMMYSGRILTGLGGGAMTLIVPVYISEIVQDKIRGTMSSLMSLTLVSGLLFSYGVGAIVSWKVLSIINGIIPLIASCICFMPDSPRYLLQKNKTYEARRALAWLRGASNLKDIEFEIKIIQASIEESNQVSTKFSDFFVPTVLKPMGITSVLFVLQQLGGIDAVMYYAVNIFESAGSDLDPNVSSIILGSVQVVFVFISTSLVDNLGRKPLLVVSDFGMAISLTALGLFFYLKQQNGDEMPVGLGWLPLVSLVLYMITYNIGIGPLPWVLLGELVPNHQKAIAGGISNSFYWGLSFIVTRSFADLNTILTPQGCYWLFAGVSLIGSLFCLLIVPETKGKSLDEINTLFK